MANLAPTWVTKAGLGVLTLNSGLAIYRARDDPASILFVSGSYTTLLLLFRCLRDYERAAPGTPARERTPARHPCCSLHYCLWWDSPSGGR